MVHLAIAAGIEPMTAIQMATINAAEAYEIDDRVGSIAPGKDADILLVDQPGTFRVQTVISKGILVTEKGENKFEYTVPRRDDSLLHTVQHAPLTADDFAYHVDMDEGKAVVETINSIGPFMRRRRDVELDVRGGIVRPSAEKDVALVSVIERYGIMVTCPRVSFPDGHLRKVLLPRRRLLTIITSSSLVPIMMIWHWLPIH